MSRCDLSDEKIPMNKKIKSDNSLKNHSPKSVLILNIIKAIELLGNNELWNKVEIFYIALLVYITEWQVLYVEYTGISHLYIWYQIRSPLSWSTLIVKRIFTMSSSYVTEYFFFIPGILTINCCNGCCSKVKIIGMKVLQSLLWLG